MLRSHRRRRIACLAAAIAAAAALPAAAQASPVDVGCPDAPLSAPFAPWNDDAPYQIAPDGGLEAGGSAWALARGAQVVAGNESFHVGGDADANALALPAGSTATTASMCIRADHRTMRFFVKRTSAGNGGALNVDVIYVGDGGARESLRLGAVAADDSWAPSPILPTVVNELAASRGGALDVSFRFTPQGGSWAIDDVYVDPTRKG